MTSVFQTILVPVDFSINTDTALEKAISLCIPGGTIHLLHIHRINHSFRSYLSQLLHGYTRQEMITQQSALAQRMQQLSNKIRLKSPGIAISTWLSFGKSVEETIICKARKIQADLIIVCKNASHTLAPFLNTVVPSRIAQKSKVAVLTTKTNSPQMDIKTIVVPVGTQYPGEKLQLLTAFQKGKRLKIRLVSFGSGKLASPASGQYLLQALRTLKQINPLPVECDVLDGKNVGLELLRYCQRVGADVLIVQSGKETKINGWFRGHIADMLPTDSFTQILAV